MGVLRALGDALCFDLGPTLQLRTEGKRVNYIQTIELQKLARTGELQGRRHCHRLAVGWPPAFPRVLNPGTQHHALNTPNHLVSSKSSAFFKNRGQRSSKSQCRDPLTPIEILWQDVEWLNYHTYGCTVIAIVVYLLIINATANGADFLLPVFSFPFL